MNAVIRFSITIGLGVLIGGELPTAQGEESIAKKWSNQQDSESDSLAKEINQALEEDLHVLTQTIPSYVVSQMPATKALEHLWITASGHKPKCIEFVWLTENNSAERTVDLALHDVSALEVIRYISEIAGARWRIRGIESVALQFELIAIETSDCSNNWVEVAVSDLTEKGAKHIGLRHAMPPKDIVQRLKLFGVKVYEERFPSASYDSNTGKLAAIVPKNETSYVQALARMADLGLLTEKPTR